MNTRQVQRGRRYKLNKDQQVEALLQQPCHIIDYLPRRVPESAGGYCFSVERYFLERKRLRHMAESYTRIILKTLCYFDYAVYTEKWLNRSDCGTLAKAIAKVVVRKKGTIDILLPTENALLQIIGGDLYITAYNCGDNIAQTLQLLAASEGLFWREGQN